VYPSARDDDLDVERVYACVGSQCFLQLADEILIFDVHRASPELPCRRRKQAILMPRGRDGPR
jgi:hypothetical protein